jgi:hypothetical protein
MILADSEESESDNIQTVGGDEDYEQLGLDQSLLQQEQARS